MKNLKYTLILSSTLINFNLHAAELLDVKFDLKEFNEKCEENATASKEFDELSGTIQSPTFFKALIGNEVMRDKDRLEGTIIILPDEKKKLSPKDMETLGMSAKQALVHSKDNIQISGCSDGHDQGDMANRWCHSAISRMFSSWLEEKGVSHGVASIAGGVFWAPKEFFYDLNPSAHDLVVSYKDSLGTKSTTFEVTVYGDAFYKKNMGKDFALFKESTPFITIKRKF